MASAVISFKFLVTLIDGADLKCEITWCHAAQYAAASAARVLYLMVICLFNLRSTIKEAALQVQDALSELHSIETPFQRLARFDKTSGFVGTTAYYAKEAFIILFMNGPGQDDYLNPQLGIPKLSKPLAKAVRLLESAARENNSDAIFLLAEMNFYGNFTHPRNYGEAFRRYHELSALTGNSSAQHMVGFMYATGIGGAVERDQAKALMYHTFAARAGDTRSEMTTAFRHHAGIGTPRDCNEAARYYKRVADKAMDFSRSGPPGGMALQREAYRLADEEGGVYGEGASVVSSGIYANKGGPNSDQHAALDDVLEYLDLMSRKGDLKATYSLGRLHYEGSRTLKRNLRTARKYFLIVARKYWDIKDGSIISEDANGVGKIASKAAAYLGRMSLRGEGMEQNYEKAIIWFRRGIANGDSFCQYEMGLMYLLGLGVRKDAGVAADYFKESAEQDWPAAQVHLGKLFLDQGDLRPAMRYFELAYRHGHIEAHYHLAEINNNGIGRERSCPLATASYKVVAEKTEALHTSFEEANRAYDSGDKETALIGYMMAAEQGYEAAQANVAYILDEHRSIVSLDLLIPWKTKASSFLRNAGLALIYWTRSAKQSNIDSMVKMGDYYLGGYGIDADMEKAATCYHTAQEMQQSGQQSAQAMWNLGWMHENGIGVDQDYHLAKRYYDLALETNQESYLPVKLSLLKLRMRSFWNTITNGKINSIQPDPEPKTYRTWSEWLANFLEDEHPYYHSDTDDDILEPHIHDPMPGGDDYYDEVDEGVLESLIILGIAGALAFLVYYRQLRLQNHRRALEQQQQQANGQANGQAGAGVPVVPAQQPDGGFFPPPGHPDHGQWVAGGVGH
ncbi:ERAD-associated protein [Xylographa trunciseda]|nr:ERAD-associated protein [Xylographa trunciseda]